MSLQPGAGDIFFLVLITSASAFLCASVHYFLNQLVDLDQTWIDTLLGGGKKLVRFL